jgi:hypothetical protein
MTRAIPMLDNEGGSEVLAGTVHEAVEDLKPVVIEKKPKITAAYPFQKPHLHTAVTEPLQKNCWRFS